jgi:hypothetical protein
MGQVYFLETGFASNRDIIVVRYLVTNNGLPGNNRSRFQGNVIKDNGI